MGHLLGDTHTLFLSYTVPRTFSLPALLLVVRCDTAFNVTRTYMESSRSTQEHLLEVSAGSEARYRCFIMHAEAHSYVSFSASTIVCRLRSISSVSASCVDLLPRVSSFTHQISSFGRAEYPLQDSRISFGVQRCKTVKRKSRGMEPYGYTLCMKNCVHGR